MNKFIAAGAAVLVLLIALSLFLTSIVNKKQEQTAGPTPIPTQVLSDKRDATYPDVELDDFEITQDETSKLEAFQSKLPYFSSNLEVAYSDELDLFFIQEKGENAEEELRELLRANGLGQIYADRPAFFVKSGDSIDTAIIKTKALLESSQGEAGKEPLRKDEQLFVDTMKTLLNFNLNNAPEGKSIPSGTNCTTGGYPFATRGQRLIGRPYQGTHTLGNWQSDNAVDLGTAIGTPVCAIAAGTIGRIKQHDPNPRSRYAGVSVYLDVGGRQWWYTHLTRVAPGIVQGARVSAGQIIGYSGAANGVPHLHLGVNNGNPIALLRL